MWNRKEGRVMKMEEMEFNNIFFSWNNIFDKG